MDRLGLASRSGAIQPSACYGHDGLHLAGNSRDAENTLATSTGNQSGLIA